jgi:Reverse transcriptase (RNA-dependent DNA polymerase)
MIPKKKKLYISRDVVFLENEPFYKKGQMDNIENSYLNESTNPYAINFGTNEALVEPSNIIGEETQEEEDTLDQIEESETSIQDDESHEDEVEPLRRSSRQTQPSTRLKDYITYSVQYSIQNYLSYKNISSDYAFLNSLSKEQEPKTFDDARIEPKWCKAMEEELDALENNETWKICHFPKNKKPVGCKWVYKIKYNCDGTIERYKARLVAKRYIQTQGIDYQETFAPVAKMNTVRILLSIAVNNKWNLQQMDVKNAFLQGTLEEEVYMNVPPGHKLENIPNLACRLKKSIYGLKQSPRAWYGKLSQFLISCNFKVSDADNSLFIKFLENCIVVILVYVDDIITIGNNSLEINNIKKNLKKIFDIKDLGKLKYFLGIEVAHSSKGLFLCQRKYILDLLKETGKLGCKPAKTPININAKLNSQDGETLEDINQYQRLVGKLIYLTVTRPDISFAVSLVSQFMHAPKTPHLDAINRILRYLKGTPGKGIWMKNNGTNDLYGYSDADWTGSFDRKSTTGFCTFVGGNLVTWKSKKQNVVAQSSAEVEYQAMASTASELTWIKQLLVDLGVEIKF